MKREELKSWLESGELSIDQKIDMIMSQNGAELESAKNDIASKASEYNSLKAQYDKVTSDFDTYKKSTKDYDELKVKLNDLLKEKDLNDKTSFLKDLKCKHADLLVGKFDWDKKEDKDYLTNFKEQYKDLFEEVKEEVKYEPKTTVKQQSFFGKKANEMTSEDLRKL